MLELLTMIRKWLIARRAKKLSQALTLAASYAEISRLRAHHQEA
jgi:hypothetical protein